MNAIYEPKGRAGEYCPLACNPYEGCGHGCTYCYAARMAHRWGTPKATFHGNPTPRKGILDALEKDAAKLGKTGTGTSPLPVPAFRSGRHAADIGWSGRPERRPSVLLSFTCDPYQPIDMDHELTRKAIQVLHKQAVRAVILTKGGRRSQRDFDLLSERPHLSAYGATLTFCCPDISAEWEPYAASPHERITVLGRAHDLGIPTWASLEPVIDPAQTLYLIRLTAHYVDHYKIGKWNYDRRARAIDWKDFVERLLPCLDTHARSWYIKRDLRPYCPPGTKFSTGEWP